MRKVINTQMQIGETDISNVGIDIRSRDEIPRLLLGLQFIYSQPNIRNTIFKLLKQIIPDGVNPNNGCPGMDLWKIFVLGAIRLICNWDYDKVHDIANNHKTIRQMLGHGVVDDDYHYALQTIKDNVSLFTLSVLDEISQVVVQAGHSFLNSDQLDSLKTRCDSFVLETDVHYPTDINLLFDAIRKAITLIARVSSTAGQTSWRQSKHNIRTIKKLFNKVRKLKRSTSNNPKKKAEKEQQIIRAHQKYIELVLFYLKKIETTLNTIRIENFIEYLKIQEIEKYIIHAYRQIDQIYRRVVLGETIPHHEKVFSIFEEHTEWISKGKAGVPQELGLRVCILEDQFGFIVHHHVMEKQTDDQVAVTMVESARQKFPNITSCSFDKGFYTPANRTELRKILEKVILPKKGRLSHQDKELEHSEQFIASKKQHSAVESAIHSLENHGLDRCLDHGIDGFKRYVALAVLARNIEKLGSLIQKKQLKRLKRKEKRSQITAPHRLAA